ncbi:PaaI family thioesterase [Desulfobacula sp.]|uniref:PaaI family thioesterase n=1 Tax=Desulfobacula sp. TaxID=2593537 RepID=UPI002621921C|nr:PaaI family thioesterase [Desulfobacula sp.]
MTQKAFQDYYPDEFSHCYGCGRLNEKGLQIKSYWEGEEAVARFLPGDHHTATPGFVYGGMIASLIDCHSTGTASAAAYRKEGRTMDTDPLRFVTAALKVDYLAPTPLGVELELRSKVMEIKEKKVVIETRVLADNKTCATGNVVAVRMPETMMTKTTQR